MHSERAAFILHCITVFLGTPGKTQNIMQMNLVKSIKIFSMSCTVNIFFAASLSSNFSHCPSVDACCTDFSHGLSSALLLWSHIFASVNDQSTFFIGQLICLPYL